MDDYNGNGIWLPYEILQNKELKAIEKILFAEIFYLDRPDTHCTASNEHLMKFCGINSVSTFQRHLSKLKEMGYIEQVHFDGRTRALSVCLKWRPLIFETSQNEDSRPLKNERSELSKNEFLLYRENKKENREETPDKPVSPKKTRRNFSKNRLSDDLESGEEIKKQTTARKKLSKEESCLNIIDKSTYSESVKELLREYFNWNYHSSSPKKIKGTSDLKQKLSRLDQLIKKKYDPKKVIQCAIDNQWYGFFEPTETVEKKYDSPGVPKDDVISQELHGEEVVDELKRREERNGVFL